MNSITVRAQAKINLGLDVLRKREDGYHEVKMIMQSLRLYDSLTISKYNGDGIRMKTNLPYLPTDQRNLVYKAALLFRDTFGITEGLQINLKKYIPVSAGLAGGSTDAAATLKGLNHLFNTGLTDTRLMELGVKLGADVPYCIMLGTALSEGIGEILTPLSPIPRCHILLVKPDLNISTRYVYENLKLTPDVRHPDISSMIQALENKDLPLLISHMDNLLESVTAKEHPIVNEIKETMKDQGALGALMSGSGPTVFGIYSDIRTATSAYYYFKNAEYAKTVYLTKPYYPDR